MRTSRIPSLAALGLLIITTASAGPEYPLRVADEARQVLDANGEPQFFAAASTWHLAMRISREDVERVLDDRAGKGFNSLLLMLMVPDGYYGAVDNFYGDAPFDLSGDFSTPNAAYFDHVEWVLDAADARGMTVFLAPAYLGFDCGPEGWCAEMQAAGVDAMRNWGRWVGQRFVDQANIVWVQGGDADASVYGVEELVDAVAEGILEVDSTHLHTAHCARNLSGEDCYDRPWLDINSTYSDCQLVTADLRQSYQSSSARPYIFIEGRYEFEEDGTDECIRYQSHAALLGGAVGNFYGSRDIWCFEPGWEATLDSKGSRDLAHYHELLQSRPWELLNPDFHHFVVKEAFGTIGEPDYVSAAYTSDGNSILAHVPNGAQITVSLAAMAGLLSEAWWFDPQTGDAQPVGNFPTFGERYFKPPSNDDWVLIVDNVAEDLPNPWEDPVATAGSSSAPTVRFDASAAVPNPFNPRTTLRFSLATPATVRLSIFNGQGRLVRRLLQEERGAGPHRVLWDGKNDVGASVTSGVYFAQLEAAGSRDTAKLVLIR